jgi:hypothetical protein
MEPLALPQNLNNNTVEAPNFITDDNVIYLSEDNIIKCYNAIT